MMLLFLLPQSEILDQYKYTINWLKDIIIGLKIESESESAMKNHKVGVELGRNERKIKPPCVNEKSIRFPHLHHEF